MTNRISGAAGETSATRSVHPDAADRRGRSDAARPAAAGHPVHRLDLTDTLTKYVVPVSLRDLRQKNVGQVRLLKADTLELSIKEAIERALSEHKDEMRRLRAIEARHASELEAQRAGFEERLAAIEREREEGRARREEEDALARAELERARAGARAAEEEVRRLRLELEARIRDVARLESERDEARTRLLAIATRRASEEADDVPSPAPSVLQDRTERLPAVAAAPAPEVISEPVALAGDAVEDPAEDAVHAAVVAAESPTDALPAPSAPFEAPCARGIEAPESPSPSPSPAPIAEAAAPELPSELLDAASASPEAAAYATQFMITEEVAAEAPPIEPAPALIEAVPAPALAAEPAAPGEAAPSGSLPIDAPAAPLLEAVLPALEEAAPRPPGDAALDALAEDEALLAILDDALEACADAPFAAGPEDVREEPAAPLDEAATEEALPAPEAAEPEPPATLRAEAPPPAAIVVGTVVEDRDEAAPSVSESLASEEVAAEPVAAAAPPPAAVAEEAPAPALEEPPATQAAVTVPAPAPVPVPAPVPAPAPVPVPAPAKPAPKVAFFGFGGSGGFELRRPIDHPRGKSRRG